MFPCRPSRRLLTATLRGLSLIAACGGLALVMACDGSTNPPPNSFGPAGPLSISCLTGDASVVVGSGPVEVLASVTRSGSPVAAQTVSFTTSRGTISPVNSTTDSSGDAISFFQASATPGTAVITATAVDGFTGEAKTCTTTVAVTDPRDPRLSVQLLTPTVVAGLNIRVVYDSARVLLPAGGVDPLSPFTGIDCANITSDNAAGLVTLNMACPTLRVTSGDVARFEFVHVAGDELDAGDFSITCVAFDERGAQLSAACAGTVLQL